MQLRCQDGRQVWHFLVCHCIVIWKTFKHHEYMLCCCRSRISASWTVLALIMGRKSEMSFKAWFCCLDSRKRLCKSHLHEKGGNMKRISVDSSDRVRGFQPGFATPYPPIHPHTSFPHLRKVTVTNLGFIFNTCKSWLRDLPLFSLPPPFLSLV